MAENISKTVPIRKSDVNDPLLEYVFIEELKDFYWTEKLFLSLLSKMHKAANSRQIKKVFKSHLCGIDKQIKRLEATFQYLENKPKFQFFEQMCLFSEGETLVSNILQNRENRDYSLVMLSQKLAQFEQKSFADIVTFAGILGFEKLSSDLSEAKNKKILHHIPLDISALCNQKTGTVFSKMKTILANVLVVMQK